ncbi:MAG: DNA polymerase III subunit beta [Planctomycetota bacterium]
MKLTCETKVLADSLALVASVVPTRSPKPVLGNVRLVAKEGTLELLATDLEVGIRRVLPDVTVEEPGEVLLPANQASGITREAPAQSISLRAEERTCTISYTGATYDLPCDDLADFPEMPTFNEKNAVTVKASDLRTMITRTKFAAAREQARFALNGVLFALKGEVLRLVATDGRRLAVAKGKAKNQAGVSAEPIIPTKAMELLDKLMEDPEETVQIEVGESQTIAQTKAGTVCTRLVEGHFPDYQDVIPKGANKSLVAPANKLLSAIRRAALITTEESRSVKFALKKDALTLNTQTLEGRRATVEAESVKYEGEPLEIAFNPDYFTDMLRVVGDEEVTVSLLDSTSAALASVGVDYQYVVMPVQLQET